MNLGWSKRAGLHAGFGAVIAVLILSAFEAYRIQVNVSRQHLEIYRRFVDQDEALATLRRNVWLAGNYVRDFFINSTPAQGATLGRQLDALAKDNEPALAVLQRTPNHQRVLPQLRASLDEYWAVLTPLPRRMASASREAEVAFLESEVVPRRGDLYNALRTLTVADEQTLMDSEGEFAQARRGAVRGLLAMLALGVFLSFLVARLALRHSDNLERKAERHFAEVEQARHELQQLSARLLEIEEEGRRRLSRELHDEIGQTLALLQIEISHAVAVAGPVPEPHRVRLERARSLVERTVQTIRDLSLLLRPALLDDLGLVPALQFQLEDFLRRSGIACEFTEDGVSADLPDTIKTCVYRIVQEALHNAEKHSAASCVKVSVRQNHGRLVAEIVDNGCGFALDLQGRPSRLSGFGLLGMRERAAIAGGTLTIDSAAGRGTRVVLIVPIPPQPATADLPARSPPEMAVRILLADDHTLLRQGLRHILETNPDFDIVAEASSGIEAVEAARRHHPDVAIVDVAMKELNGIEATAQILKHSPQTAVLMLSMYSDERYVLRAVKAGARGYVLKNSAGEELIQAIQNVQRGLAFFSPAVARIFQDGVARLRDARETTDRYESLTDRERQVYQLLAEGNSNKDIANRLNLSLHTVETHRWRIMEKMDLHSTAELVLSAVRRGLVT